jgi:uncharacterized protein DUF3987
MALSVSFLGIAKKYAKYTTDAPMEFTEITALQDLGLALGPDVVCRIQPKAVHHNMYVALMGQSTLARKNTVQENIGEDIVPSNMRLPKGGSPEGFLEALDDMGGRGIQYMGEWSEELKGIKSGNYMATFAELKNNLFNCQPYSKKLTTKKNEKSESVIKKPYLCAHTTITPDVLKEKMTKEMADGGYVARHLIVAGQPNPRPRGRLNADVSAMVTMLKKQFNWIDSLDKSGCHFEPSDEALKFYNEVVEKECSRPEFEIVSSCSGRYQNYTFAIADLLWLNEATGQAYYQGLESKISKLVDLVTLVELVENISSYVPKPNAPNTTNPTNSTNSTKQALTNSTNATNSTNSQDVVLIVQKRHMEEAWRIVKNCLVSAREIVEFVDMGKPLAKVREYIRKHYPNAVNHSEALRMTNLDKEEFRKAIETLDSREEITIVPVRFQRGYVTDEKLTYIWGREESKPRKPTPSLTPEQIAKNEEALEGLVR